MKNKIKMFAAMHSIAIIAIAAIIGFSFIACDNGDENGNNDNGGTVDTASFAGTWNKAPLQLIISGNNFTIKNNSVDAYKGTLTFTGTETAGTIAINITHINHSGSWQEVEVAFNDNGTYTAAANTFTISGLTVDGIALANGIWTKQGNGHSHSYSETWSKDATQHWKECSCGDKTQIANHTGNPCVCGYESGSIGNAWYEGTWNKTPLQLIINGNNFTIKNNSVDAYKGTLTFTGTETAGTITINVTHINHSGNWQGVEIAFTDNGTYTATASTLTISELTVDGIALANGAWSKDGTAPWVCNCNTCETNCGCIKAECDPVCTCGCDDQSETISADFRFTLINDNKEYSVYLWNVSDATVAEIPATYNSLPVTQIESEGFLGASMLKSITIPSSIKIIGTHAFRNCTNVKNLTIPSSVTTVGFVQDSQGAFPGWTSSQTINVPFDNQAAADAAWGSYWRTNCNAIINYIGGGSNPTTWTAVVNSTFGTRQINGIAYGNNKFVAVGRTDFVSGNWASNIAYSSDGTTWTAVTNSTFGSDNIQAVVWGSDKFVAVGLNGTSGQNGIIAYSSNGETWTAVTNSNFGSEDINGIAWGNNKFVAVGKNGKMVHSSNGITWTAVADSTFDTSVIHAIAWGDNKFVAVGQHGKMAYSSNGETWTAITSASSTFNGRCMGIVWGNNKFVAVGESGRIAYSSDGISWTAVTNSTFPSGDNAVRGIAWGNNMFVAGNRGQLSYSTDGITWTASANSTFSTFIIYGIAYGNNKFVAVGESGKMAYSDSN